MLKGVMTWAKVTSLVRRFWNLPWTNGPNTQFKWKLQHGLIKYWLCLSGISCQRPHFDKLQWDKIDFSRIIVYCDVFWPGANYAVNVYHCLLAIAIFPYGPKGLYPDQAMEFLSWLTPNHGVTISANQGSLQYMRLLLLSFWLWKYWGRHAYQSSLITRRGIWAKGWEFTCQYELSAGAWSDWLPE